jgi:hypothetical protein
MIQSINYVKMIYIETVILKYIHKNLITNLFEQVLDQILPDS